MRFVPIKSDDQMDLQSLHRVRERWVARRTATPAGRQKSTSQPHQFISAAGVKATTGCPADGIGKLTVRSGHTYAADGRR